jgi:ketosteroid isomerase-like protein
MTTEQFAREFATLLTEGDEAGYQAMWADDIVSLEPHDGEMARVEGREALLAKHAWWSDNTETHSSTRDGPYVFDGGFGGGFDGGLGSGFGGQFAFRFSMDVTMNGERWQRTEVGVYTVKDGKIAEERFFYDASDY